MFRREIVIHGELFNITASGSYIGHNNTVNFPFPFIVLKERISDKSIRKIRFKDLDGSILEHSVFNENAYLVQLKRLYATKPTYLSCEYEVD